MTPTGVFITKEELDGLLVEQSTSGMFLSGGRPMGDPGGRTTELNKKYGLSGCAINTKTGEFIKP